MKIRVEERKLHHLYSPSETFSKYVGIVETDAGIYCTETPPCDSQESAAEAAAELVEIWFSELDEVTE